MKYSIFIKQLFVVAKSKWLFYAIQGHVFSLASFEIVSNLKKKTHGFKTIIDVGANSGQFTGVISHFYSTAKIFAFEPIPNLYSKVEKKFKNNNKVYIINNSELMTIEAQNCLLKTLEEPPEYVVIILIVLLELM